ARVDLSGLHEAAGARPKIFVALNGPLAAPTRSIDASALTGWLTLRAVENQTKKLRAIESVPPQPQDRGMPKTKHAPALPAPIDIRPVPPPRSAGQPAPSVRSQNWVDHARALQLAVFTLGDALLAVDPIVVNDKKADRGRQVAVTTIGVDRRDQVRERNFSAVRDFLPSLP